MTRRRGRLAVVGAAALLEQFRLVVERRGRRTSRAASARSPAPPRPAACRSPARARPPGRCSRSSAGSRTGWRGACASVRPGSRSPRPARRRRRRGEQLRQPVDAVDEHLPDPRQVVEPGVVQPHPVRGTPNRSASRRWKPIATLHRPIARWPSSSSARVTMPTGLVKSTIQASGSRRAWRPVRRCRARPARCAAPWRTRPGPVVSWPSRPNLPGSVSSTSRACWPPTRSWISTAARPSTASSSDVVVRQPAGEPVPREDPPGQPADDVQPLGRDVVQHQLVDGSTSARRANPSISSGV